MRIKRWCSACHSMRWGGLRLVYRFVGDMNPDSMVVCSRWPQHILL